MLFYMLSLRNVHRFTAGWHQATSVTFQGRNVVCKIWFSIYVFGLCSSLALTVNKVWMWVQSSLIAAPNAPVSLMRTDLNTVCRCERRTSSLALFPRLPHVWLKNEKLARQRFPTEINNCTYDITEYVDAAFVCDLSFELCRLNTLKP